MACVNLPFTPGVTCSPTSSHRFRSQSFPLLLPCSAIRLHVFRSQSLSWRIPCSCLAACVWRVCLKRFQRLKKMRTQVHAAAVGELYVEPVFRPPAESASVILQVTNGCSWNRCSFCEMYTAEQKAFRVKSDVEIESDLKILAELRRLADDGPPPRVFLADGDAMSLPVRKLVKILERVNLAFPDVARISSYCLPRNLQAKSVQDLQELRKLGLRTLYVGCESGDNDVLRRVGKGETYESSLTALRKIKDAGLKSSVMILHGLGGKRLSQQHAEASAALMNDAQPAFVSTLVASFPLGLQRHAQGFSDLTSDGAPGFLELSRQDVLTEMRQFIERLELRKTIFRSDHASNYLALQGVLGRDKTRLLAELEAAELGKVELRPEWARGL